MEVGIIKVKDQHKTTSKVIFHRGSKDSIKEFKEHIIKDKRDPNLLKRKCLTNWQEKKRIINMYKQKFVELTVFKANTNVFQANTNASLKNLETKVEKLALNLQN